MNPRAVAYYRMSTKKIDQAESIPQQRTWAAGAAKLHGLEIAREFDDPGVVGAEIEHRPGLQAMLRWCEAEAAAGRPIPFLLVYDADRLSRASNRKTAAILDRLEEAGTSKIVSAEGVVDLTDDTDSLIYDIKQTTGKAAYSKNLSRNVIRGMVSLARQGFWGGGPVPYAYVAQAVGEHKKLTLGPAVETEAVEWLFQTYALTTTSLSRLVEQLTARGVPPPHSRRNSVGKWTKYAVWGILTNPVYTGDHYYGRRRQGRYHRVKNGTAEPIKPKKTANGAIKQEPADPADAIVIRDNHPALVSREVFATVQARLKSSNLNQTTKTRKNVDWPLAGKLRCGDCGGVMWGLTLPGRPGFGKTQIRKYACSTYLEKDRTACSFNAVEEEDLITLILSALRRALADDTITPLLDQIRKQRAQYRTGTAFRVEMQRQTVAELAAKIAQATINLATLPADLREDVIAVLRSWKDQKAEADKELKQMEQAADEDAQEEEDLRYMDASYKKLRGQIPAPGTCLEWTVAAQEVVRSHIERVELHFTHTETPKRRFSRCTEITVHFLPLTGLAPTKESWDEWGTVRPCP